MLTGSIDTIIHGCVKNDRTCQKQLYEIFAPRMYSVCTRYARNRADAKDIFQSGFLKVLENISQLRNIDSIEWWMQKIFVNEALLLYRREQKTQNVDFEDTFDKLDEQYTIINELEVEYITGLIQKLPDKMRLVFNMYIIEGYSHQEIATHLNISEGTSKSHLHDARKNLIKKINNLTPQQKAW
jgi:RNA polymerase sigma factor (sigma-70 family)